MPGFGDPEVVIKRQKLALPTAKQIADLIRAADFVRRTGRRVGPDLRGSYVAISAETFKELCNALEALPGQGKQP